MILWLAIGCAAQEYKSSYGTDVAGEDSELEAPTEGSEHEDDAFTGSEDYWWRVYVNLALNAEEILTNDSNVAIVLYNDAFEPDCYQLCHIIESERLSYTNEGEWWVSLQIKPTSIDESPNSSLSFQGLSECASMPPIPTNLHFGVGPMHQEIRAVWDSIDWLESDTTFYDESVEQTAAYISIDNGENLWAYGAAISSEIELELDEDHTDSDMESNNESDSEGDDDDVQGGVGTEPVMEWFLRPAFFFPI